MLTSHSAYVLSGEKPGAVSTRPCWLGNSADGQIIEMVPLVPQYPGAYLRCSALLQHRDKVPWESRHSRPPRAASRAVLRGQDCTLQNIMCCKHSPEPSVILHTPAFSARGRRTITGVKERAASILAPVPWDLPFTRLHGHSQLTPAPPASLRLRILSCLEALGLPRVRVDRGLCEIAGLQLHVRASRT